MIISYFMFEYNLITNVIKLKKKILIIFFWDVFIIVMSHILRMPLFIYLNKKCI